MNSKVTLIILLVLAVSITLSLVLVFLKREEKGIGLAVGGWAEYESILGYFPIGAQEIKNFTQRVKVKVESLEGTNITFAVTTQLENGSEVIRTTKTNTATGELSSPYNPDTIRTLSLSPSNWSTLFSNASTLFISPNSTIGESILGGSMLIASESTATCAGANRTVVEFTQDEHIEHPTGGPMVVFICHSAAFYWDKLTGVLLRCTFQEYCAEARPGHGSMIYQWENHDFKLVDTNMW